jgi:hypothetical protein
MASAHKEDVVIHNFRYRPFKPFSFTPSKSMPNNLILLSAMFSKPSLGTVSLVLTELGIPGHPHQQAPNSNAGSTASGEPMPGSEGTRAATTFPQEQVAPQGDGDRIYVKVNGIRIYSIMEYVADNSQQAIVMGYTVPIIESITIQLWEKNVRGADNILAALTIDPDHEAGQLSHVVINHTEESICRINIRITEDNGRELLLANQGKPARPAGDWQNRLSLEEEWEFLKTAKTNFFWHLE